MKFEEAARTETARNAVFISGTRRRPLLLAALAAVVAAPLTQALAQGGSWPTKPITFVVPRRRAVPTM